MNYRLIIGLGLLMVSTWVGAWQEAPPAIPSLTLPSSAQLQAAPPADLLQSTASVNKLPSAQQFQAWDLPVSANLAISAAEALLAQVRLLGYPAYLAKNGAQAVVIVGPEADLNRLQAWQITLQQTLSNIGNIQSFDPLRQTEGTYS